MQNLSTIHAPDIRGRDEIYIPAGRRSRTAHVDVRDVAAVAARALVEDGHAGRAYTPTGRAALTYDFGLAASLTDDVERITGMAPIDFATFARDYRETWEPAAG